MFTNAEATIARILAIVDRCPDQFKEKCFEVLLSAYATAQFNQQTQAPQPPARSGTAHNETTTTGAGPAIPEAIRQRFLSAAARLKVQPEKMATLFDFNADPFTFHALAVPGDSKADKTRSAALLLAAKSYLATGAWSADWKELRAMCVDQGCYDRGNMNTYLKSPHFKTASATENVTLTSAGVSAAEALLTSLINPEAD